MSNNTEVQTHDCVARIEEKYPEMTAEFKRIQMHQYQLFCRKQEDYGSGNISLGTPLITDEERKMSLTGLWFRINDKIQRIKNLLMESSPTNNEPMEDSFLDASNYSIMALIVTVGKWGK